MELEGRVSDGWLAKARRLVLAVLVSDRYQRVMGEADRLWERSGHKRIDGDESPGVCGVQLIQACGKCNHVTLVGGAMIPA